MRQYYESHITIEPVFDEGLEKFIALCAKYQYRVAKLLMQKARKDTPERSSKDSFCTGHSDAEYDLRYRMDALTEDLLKEGFKVWRRKIEHVIFDERLA